MSSIMVLQVLPSCFGESSYICVKGMTHHVNWLSCKMVAFLGCTLILVGHFFSTQDLHLGFSVFLISVMRDNPRTAIIYLLIFQYHTVLLPVIHASTPVLEDIANINLYIAQVCEKLLNILKIAAKASQTWPNIFPQIRP